MKVSELQKLYINELKSLLPEWKFVTSGRHFKLRQSRDVMWLLHISCINHDSDFDSIGSVAVEYFSGKQRICIIGAELGNIEGRGQTRFPVSTPGEAILSAKELYNFFVQVGLPFLNKFSDSNAVISVLRAGGENAMLISPFINQHEEQIKSLCQTYNIDM